MKDEQRLRIARAAIADIPKNAGSEELQKHRDELVAVISILEDEKIELAKKIRVARAREVNLLPRHPEWF